LLLPYNSDKNTDKEELETVVGIRAQLH
jgi:hypothetical protein